MIHESNAVFHRIPDSMNLADRFREQGTISLRRTPSLIVLAIEGDRSGNEAVQFAAESSLDTSHAGFVVEPLS